jgi:preprotein translocase subunit SecF
MQIFRPDTNFDFIGKWRLFAGVSGGAVAVSILLLAAVGLNMGIDFTGGTLVQIQFNKAQPIGDVRGAVSALSLGDVVVQNFGSDREFLIRVEKSLGSTRGVGELVAGTLSNKFGSGSFEVRRTESVGPKVGADLREKAMSSMIFALVGILLYVSFRFQFRQAVAAVIALLHDVIVTMGVFVISGKEFSLPIVAALLTIIGYSLNDTIVVFDRIRENTRLSRRSEFSALINRSVNQTLSRTVLTSGTTLVAVIAFLVLGGEVIADVAFTLVVGIIAGTYSSVYIASPLLLAWPGKGAGKSSRAGKKSAAKA